MSPLPPPLGLKKEVRGKGPKASPPTRGERGCPGAEPRGGGGRRAARGAEPGGEEGLPGGAEPGRGEEGLPRGGWGLPSNACEPPGAQRRAHGPRCPQQAEAPGPRLAPSWRRSHPNSPAAFAARTRSWEVGAARGWPGTV
ncbi:unnamed protein product [Natator depressus]